jgi:hypothetical protein
MKRQGSIPPWSGTRAAMARIRRNSFALGPGSPSAVMATERRVSRNDSSASPSGEAASVAAAIWLLLIILS